MIIWHSFLLTFQHGITKSHGLVRSRHSRAEIIDNYRNAPPHQVKIYPLGLMLQLAGGSGAGGRGRRKRGERKEEGREDGGREGRGREGRGREEGELSVMWEHSLGRKNLFQTPI